ncbi:MAG TPA: hypothetical protein DDW87_12440 [Firmicutes bacterium]|nr:hypothetical protein [Bacillota bacterium]
MHEEQRMILRMLEEGKITADEAEALLNALGGRTESPESEPQEDPWARLEKMGEDFASKVEVATERFSRSLEHNVSDKLTKLPKILARFPFFGYEESQEFTRVVRGKVGPGEVIPIDLSNVNGSIRVQGWSEEEYQLTVVQRLRGRDRELLRSRLFDIAWEDGAEKADFTLAIPNVSDASISLHLMVPEERLYEVGLFSQNGSLRVENLKSTTLQVDTINGSTRMHSVRAQTIRGEGGNGSCEMEGVEAKAIRHELGNGSYRLSLSATDLDLLTTNGSVNVRVSDVLGDARYRLRTTNGAIKVSLPAQVDLGLSLDLQTAVGRISTEVSALEITRQERQGGGALLAAHSVDYAGKADKLDLEASSTSGSIAVSAREA